MTSILSSLIFSLSISAPGMRAVNNNRFFRSETNLLFVVSITPASKDKFFSISFLPECKAFIILSISEKSPLYSSSTSIFDFFSFSEVSFIIF